MNRYVTQGIVLNRTDFGEADRIITFLTPDHGKIRTIAKGVRKAKSKIAGGIELFSISDLTILVGRGEVDTLMSARLHTHFGQIVKDAARTQAGYEAIKLINKATEDQPEPAYFDLLASLFEALDNIRIEPVVASLWFNLQLLKLAGHAPDLYYDVAGAKLAPATAYDFQLEDMRFSPKDKGLYTADDIKFLRVGFAAAQPQILQKISGSGQLAANVSPLLVSALKIQFHL